VCTREPTRADVHHSPSLPARLKLWYLTPCCVFCSDMLEDMRPDMEDWMEGPDKNPFGVSGKKLKHELFVVGSRCGVVFRA